MPKEEWGVKRLCPTTGKRFYDLNKTPIVSPYTGEVVQIETPGRKGAPLQSESTKAKAKPETSSDDDDVLLDDDDDADVSIDDEDILDDDDDDSTVSFDELGDVADKEDDS